MLSEKEKELLRRYTGLGWCDECKSSKCVCDRIGTGLGCERVPRKEIEEKVS